MPEIVDVFNSDIFTMKSLTDSINKLPFKPARIGQMGLFSTQGIPTTSLMVEERDGQLFLIPTQPRGGPANKMKNEKRTARSLVVPHIPLEDVVLASEVQNVRQFGSVDMSAGVAQVVNDKMEVMRQSHEVTLEYQRLGALRGIILDADGATTIYNLFIEFNVSPDTVDFALDVDTTDVRSKVLEVKRLVELALSGVPFDHVHAFTGKTWFERLIRHPTVYEAYERWQDGQMSRSDPRKGFEFCGVIFEEYTGTVSTKQFVADGDCHFFPVGAPNLFKTVYAPGDFIEAVNTIGLPMYAKSELMEYGRGIKLLTESNPLSICLRPKALVTGTTET